MAEKISRREQKKIHSRRMILEAAVRQFSQKGFQDTSIADIMNEADLGIGTFYNYFESKEDVLGQLLEQLVGSLRTTMEGLLQEQKSPTDVLAALVMQTAELLSMNRFVLPLFLSAAERAGMPEGVMAASPEVPSFKQIFDQVIQAGQASGDFRKDIPAAVITEIFHSMFQAAAFSSLPFSFAENVRMKVQLVLEGLRVKQ